MWIYHISANFVVVKELLKHAWISGPSRKFLIQKCTKMTAVGEIDSSLSAKCLDLCQTLAGQGLAFNFSLKIGSSFSFSLDARDKGPASNIPGKTKKRPSPSRLRRNARRMEAFLKRKLSPAPVTPESDCEPDIGVTQLGANIFKCDICENVFKSDNALRIHKGKDHKIQELPQLEKTRGPDIEKSLQMSPSKDVREELPNMQLLPCGMVVFACESCGDKYNSKVNFNNHKENPYNALCKQFYLASPSWVHWIVTNPILCGVTTLKVFADWKILRGCFGKYTSDLIWELENKQIVLGEIQRCSKRSVDITCLQMQTAEFDKCTTAKPSNPYIGSAQIHANPWGPLLSHAYVGTFCHWDNHSHWKRWLIIIILMIKLCQIY